MKTESPTTSLPLRNEIKYCRTRRACIRLCAVFIAAVLVAQTPVEVTMAMNNKDSATAVEISIDRDSKRIYLMTISNGCTRSTDFDFGRNADGAITARRIRADQCRKKTSPVLFAYDLSQVCEALSKGSDESRIVVKGTSRGQKM